MSKWWAAAALAVVGATLAVPPAAAVVVPVATVHGMTLAPDGSPYPAQVHVYTAVTDGNDWGLADEQWVTAGDDGTYTLDLHVASSYYIEVGHPDGLFDVGFDVFDAAPDSDTTCDAYLVGEGQPVSSQVLCSPPWVVVERFWSQKFNNAHFFTTSQAEAQHLRTSDPNWAYENPAFTGIGAIDGRCQAGLAAVFRFYSAKFQSHFYTVDVAEKNGIIAGDPAWAYEGVAYCASLSEVDTTPLYRFWSPKFGKHFFTANQAEADHIRAVDTNWTYEGIAYYVW